MFLVQLMKLIIKLPITLTRSPIVTALFRPYVDRNFIRKYPIAILAYVILSVAYMFSVLLL